MHYIVCAMLLVTLTSCTSPLKATGNLQCVPYARQVSGIQIYGNAYTWWDKAAPKYKTSNKPTQGAVLVLAKTKRLPYGHVAVVDRVIDMRHIDVSHANWGKSLFGHGEIYEGMRVADISQNNDWSRVKFWSPDAEGFGQPYTAKGFIAKAKPKPEALASVK